MIVIYSILVISQFFLQMQFPEIHFGGKNPKLHSYNKYNWLPGETRKIEFYPNVLTSVTLLYSSDPSLYDKLSTLIDGKPISIDLEWAQPYSHSPHPIELFQFSSSKGTIIVASDANKGYDQIAKFLHSSTFFGKGMSSDKKKLRQCCGESFDDIEDIETTRLLPNELPVNFEALTLMFLGHGTAQFKDHKVQRSDWSLRPLTILQILYGGHDSYAMLKVYEKIIEKYGPEIKPYVKKKTEKEKKKKQKSKKDEDFIKKNREIHFIDLDDYFGKKHITLNYDLESDKWFDEQPASLPNLLYKYEVSQKKDVKDEDSCFIENANEVLTFLLPTKTQEKKNKILERICLTSDLFLLGIIHQLKDGTFSCQACDKHLYDPISLIQHSESRHCKNSQPDHKLDSKDVLLQYLIAVNQVKGPFKVVFDKSELQNLTIQEAESDDEMQEEEDCDIGKIYKDVITPRIYNESDGIKCLICNKDFDSVESLRNHCWLNHYDIFVKLATGKEIEKQKEGDDKILHQFGLFCINQLHMGTVSHGNLIIKCGLCKFCITTPAKFFMHAFFKHQEFAIVKKEQYNKWPIRYNLFNSSMIKQVKYIPEILNFDELDECKLYDKKQNKCIECNKSFKNDEERADHFIKEHLIYFPLELPPFE